MRSSYRFSVRAITLSLAISLPPALLLWLLAVVVALPARTSDAIRPFGAVAGLVSAVALGAAAVFCALAALILTMLPVSTIFGRLRIGPSGIAYIRWPFRRIVGQWSEVDHVSSTNLLGRTTVMLYIRRKSPGWERSIGPGVFGSRQFKIIPLSDFRGWSEGLIQHDLSQYAPRLLQPLTESPQ